ncbi:MAG: hypothetical protein WBW94_09145 [Anaerolineales bacterium]
MSAKHTKWIVAGCLSLGLLGILLCLLSGIGVKTMIDKWNSQNSCFNDRAPLSSFTLTLDRSKQNQLIQTSQKFAIQNGFKFHIEYFTPDHEDFVVDGIRKDTEVVIGNTYNYKDIYFVSFYNYDCIHPTIASDIDGLVNDLKSSISQIPTATITDMK